MSAHELAANELADRLVENFEAMQQRYNSSFNMDTDLNLQTFLAGVHGYSAFAAKALETFVSRTAYRDIHSPSYKPFVAPFYAESGELDSEILSSPMQLLPLALYSDALQGQWQRLYSSSVDGNSFNRIVHHILGYDVRPTR